MSKVRLLIVEDELLIAEELSAYLTGQGFDVVDTVTNAVDAKRALEVYQIDMLLIDIKLKGEEDGISIGQYVLNEYSLPFIFTTSLIDQETVARAAQAKPAAYLVKPYNYKEIQIAIEMAMVNFQSKQAASSSAQNTFTDSHYLMNGQVFIKDKGRFEKVQYEDIWWLKAENSYVKVHTASKDYLLTSDTLGTFLVKLQLPQLIRIHRSFAVNIAKISAFEGNQLFIADLAFPIGKNYKSVLREHFHIL